MAETNLIVWTTAIGVTGALVGSLGTLVLGHFLQTITATRAARYVATRSFSRLVRAYVTKKRF